MRGIYLIYGLSGLVSLGYQVVWFRTFIDRFGSTNLTFALVVTHFIGGLGLGALASRRTTGAAARFAPLRDPVRLYGAIEIAIAAAASLTLLSAFLPEALWGTFPYRAGPSGVFHPTLVYRLSELLLAGGLVLVPSFLMGLTFPLLCRAFRHDPRFPAALYAWNTLGACLGVLATEFVFLPWIGYGRALVLFIGVNLALGLALLLRGAAPEQPAVAPAVEPAARTLPFSVLIAAAVVGGLLTGGVEADMFQRVRFTGCRTDVGMSFVSFWAILAIFLAAWTVRTLPRLRLTHIKIAFGAALPLYMLVWHQAYALRRFIDLRSAAPAVDSSATPPAAPTLYTLQSGLPGILVYVGLFVFPTFYLLSLLLPYVCNRAQAGRRHVGAAYGWNTVAFCSGMIAFTWVAPRINVFYALKLFPAIFGVLVVLLWLLSERRALRPWKPALAVAAAAVCCAVVPARFDPGFLPPGNPAARYPVRAMKSNGAHTTYVVEDPEGLRLHFGSHSMSGTGLGDQLYMRLMAHLPLLAHPHPESALLICFGVGNTASAIAAHETIERIDVVDLNHRVFETAPEFAETNRDVYADPRVSLIHDDGRSFLNLTDRTYDLVTSEPPPPMHEGVFRLYSTEYYTSVLDRLSPAGMMTQWVPLRQLSPSGAKLAIASFIEVFPHALLFVGHDDHVILLGARNPIDLRNVAPRYAASPAVARDLLALNVNGPLPLLARILQGDATLRREYGDGPTISDRRNDLAHQLLDPYRPPVVRYDPNAVLAEIRADRLQDAAELRRLLTNLARLKSTVQDFPVPSLMTVRSTPSSSVAFAGADWTRIDRLNRAAVDARKAGNRREAANLFQQSLSLVPAQTHVLASTARLHLELQDFQASLSTWRAYLELLPNDGQAHYGAGRALFYLGQNEAALAELETAATLIPDSPLPHKVRGDVLATIGNLQEAMDSYDRALELDPTYERARINREKVHSQL